ncbi:MAG: hypothetical protein ACJAZ4_002532 [Neptuniibacter pectenicola]|jgi:hypothetical protein
MKWPIKFKEIVYVMFSLCLFLLLVMFMMGTVFVLVGD